MVSLKTLVEKGHMEIQEQVYTSARKLLGSHQGDLGVVAQSIGFPNKLDSDLNGLCSYRILENLPSDDPSLHPPRLILLARGTNKELFSFSRMVFAGADHTGRTAPLAHHVVVSREQIQTSHASLAEILRSLKSLFVSQWQEDPIWFNPPRQVSDLNRIEFESQFPNPLWFSFANRSVIARLFGQFAIQMTSEQLSNSTPLILVLPESVGDQITDLICDLLAVLPTSFQFKVGLQTHVISPTDVVGGCKVLFTYPGTLFLEQARSRKGSGRPIVYDLTLSEFPKPEISDYGVWIESQINSSSPFSQIKTGVILREQLGEIHQTEGSPFIDVERLQQTLSSPDAFANFDQLTELIARVCSASINSDVLANSLTAAAIRNHFKINLISSDWWLLSRIADNKRWPVESRKLAIRAIEKFPEKSYPFYFEAIGLSESTPNKTRENLRNVFQRDPKVVAGLIDQAGQGQESLSLKAIDRVFRVLFPVVDASLIQSWHQRISDAPQGSRTSLKMSFGYYVCHAIKSEILSIEETKSLLPGFTSYPFIMQKLIFELLEKASTDEQTLTSQIEWVSTYLEEEGKDFTSYDRSDHSNVVQRRLEEYVSSTSKESPREDNESERRSKRTQNPSNQQHSRSNTRGHTKSPREKSDAESTTRVPIRGKRSLLKASVVASCLLSIFVTICLLVAWWYFDLPFEARVLSLAFGPIVISCLLASMMFLLAGKNKDLRKRHLWIWRLKLSIGLVLFSIIWGVIVESCVLLK
jgi:hypothetical protein